MSGWTFLGIAAVMSLGLFLNGLRFARMDRNPWAGRTLLGMPVQGSAMSVGQVRWIGRVQMIFAPCFLVLAAAIAFGLLGPVNGVTPISLSGGAPR